MFGSQPTYPTYDEWSGSTLEECPICFEYVEDDWIVCPKCTAELFRPSEVSDWLCCNNLMVHTPKYRVRNIQGMEDTADLANLVTRSIKAQEECLICGAIWYDLEFSYRNKKWHREPDNWNAVTCEKNFKQYLKLFYDYELN